MNCDKYDAMPLFTQLIDFSSAFHRPLNFGCQGLTLLFLLPAHGVANLFISLKALFSRQLGFVSRVLVRMFWWFTVWKTFLFSTPAGYRCLLMCHELEVNEYIDMLFV